VEIVASNVVPAVQLLIFIKRSGLLLTGTPVPPEKIATTSPSLSLPILQVEKKAFAAHERGLCNPLMSKVIDVQVAVPVFLTAQSPNTPTGLVKVQLNPSGVMKEKLLPDIKFVNPPPTGVF
jgi:hypothetical protein